jgi:hypothetical protein
VTTRRDGDAVAPSRWGRRVLPPLVMVSVLAAAGVARADAGDLDPSFGLDGKVTTSFVGARTRGAWRSSPTR